jgi:hypothetical protein
MNINAVTAGTIATAMMREHMQRAYGAKAEQHVAEGAC